MAVDERGEHAMSNEICRRCNGKQQGRRRGGRSVQIPDSFIILHSSSRHWCTYTYALYVRPSNSTGKRGRKPPRKSGLGMDMYLCAKIQGVSLRQKTAWTLSFGVENMFILRSCLWLLGFSVGWSFCVMFHWIFSMGRSDLGNSTFPWNALKTTCP